MRNYGKSSSTQMGMPDLQTITHVVCLAKRTTSVQQSRDTLSKTNQNGEHPMDHPECINPPQLLAMFTDEDYALVCNVWRRELGLEPLV